jgi:hypothetical protein
MILCWRAITWTTRCADTQFRPIGDMTHCTETQRWIILWQVDMQRRIIPWQVDTQRWIILWQIDDWLILFTTTILPGAQPMLWMILCTGDRHI